MWNAPCYSKFWTKVKRFSSSHTIARNPLSSSGSENSISCWVVRKNATNVNDASKDNGIYLNDTIVKINPRLIQNIFGLSAEFLCPSRPKLYALKPRKYSILKHDEIILCDLHWSYCTVLPNFIVGSSPPRLCNNYYWSHLLLTLLYWFINAMIRNTYKLGKGECMLTWLICHREKVSSLCSLLLYTIDL